MELSLRIHCFSQSQLPLSLSQRAFELGLAPQTQSDRDEGLSGVCTGALIQIACCASPEAILYWTSIPGGQLTQDEAQTKWDQMVANKDKDETLWDLKGPKEKYRLRLRIHTADHVDFENAAIRSKEVVL